MIDQSEKAEMARIMRLLSENASTDDQQPVPPPAKHGPHVSGIVPEAQLSSSLAPLAADMKSIMEKIKRASEGAVEHLDRDSGSDNELREAMSTEEIDGGARIGGWEIRTHGAGKRKFFDVGRVGESAVIAADLTLYEAAYGLVRILNEGGTVNSREAVKLLHAEMTYNAAVQDMVQFKHMLESRSADVRRAVYEDRYSAAKRKALLARDQVQTMSRSSLT